MSDLDQVASSSLEIAITKREKEIQVKAYQLKTLHNVILYLLYISVILIVIKLISCRKSKTTERLSTQTTTAPEEQRAIAVPTGVQEPLQSTLRNAVSQLEISVTEEETHSSHFHTTGYSVYPRL